LAKYIEGNEDRRRWRKEVEKGGGRGGGEEVEGGRDHWRIREEAMMPPRASIVIFAPSAEHTAKYIINIHRNSRERGRPILHRTREYRTTRIRMTRLRFMKRLKFTS